MGDGPLGARDFEQVVMPHLDAAYNLACWMTRNPADAQDVVQEAALRAFKYIDTYTGENAAAWFLSIVRRACFTWLKRNRRREEVAGLDDEETEQQRDAAVPPLGGHDARNPEALLIVAREKQELRDLIGRLPPDYREVIVLREIEELSYRDIAEVVGVPIGTVMSRLARARALLHRSWQREQRE